MQRPGTCRSGDVQHGGRSRTLGRRGGESQSPAERRAQRSPLVPSAAPIPAAQGFEASLVPSPASGARGGRQPVRPGCKARRETGNPKTGRGRSRGSAAPRAAGVWRRPACPRCNPGPGAGGPPTPRCGRAAGAGVLSARGGARRESVRRGSRAPPRSAHLFSVTQCLTESLFSLIDEI